MSDIDFSQMKTAAQIEADNVEADINRQIAVLEASVTDRNLRGAALGDQYAIDHIQSVEDQIALLRA